MQTRGSASIVVREAEPPDMHSQAEPGNENRSREIGFFNLLNPRHTDEPRLSRNEKPDFLIFRNVCSFPGSASRHDDRGEASGHAFPGGAWEREPPSFSIMAKPLTT